MAIRYKRVVDITLLGLLTSLLIVPSARSVTGTSSQLVEDFTTDTFADYAATTGLWDLPDHKARAGVVADAVGSGAARPITFGDGSDGVLSSGSGATFDTNSHPNGFNFKSIDISAGAITVTGTNALIIRSLSNVNIALGVVFSVDGQSDVAGSLSGVASGSTTGPAGGTAVTCGANGGKGGNASPLTVGNGNDGLLSSGLADNPTGGAGHDDTAQGAGSGTDASPSLAALLPDGPTFDTTGFVCGPGGGGGGGDTSGNGGAYGTGGAGGGGGGRVRVTSVGNMTINATITARGGHSGRGADAGAICGGNGAGGNGGSIWLQALGAMPAVTTNVTVGTGNTNSCNAAPVDGFNAGATRFDFAGAALDTVPAAPNQTYVVQSKAYDLGTLNAGFSGATIVSSNGAGSAPTVEFAGSADGVSFSAFSSDVTLMSGKSFRFVRFKITIRTGAAAGNSPEVTRIALNYNDLGLEKLDLKISSGCGTITGMSDDPASPRATMAGVQLTLAWLCFWILCYRVMRYGFVLKTRRLPSRKLPSMS
ncbi:MAG: hypothetical protein HY074_03045 [Deltaproteobacteria bacterium]|nr:hypothetical protein [Deltaproteobacteria bacterium]